MNVSTSSFSFLGLAKAAVFSMLFSLQVFAHGQRSFLGVCPDLDIFPTEQLFLSPEIAGFNMERDVDVIWGEVNRVPFLKIKIIFTQCYRVLATVKV